MAFIWCEVTEGPSREKRSFMLFGGRFVIWCLLLLTLLFTRQISAQYRFDAYTTDDGLPQNGVRNISQTPDGYLWFTTFDGLVRYDGVRFTVFDKNNTSGIGSNRFSTLIRLDDGSLLAGTEDGGLVEYRDGVFRSYTTADGLPSNTIFSIRNDVRGELYIVTSAGNVYLRGGVIVPAAITGEPESNFSYRGTENNFWYYENDRIIEIKADKRRVEYPITLRSLNERLSVIRGFEDREGNLWFGDLNGVYSLKDGQYRKLTEKDGVPKATLLRPFVQDAEGGIWFTSGWGDTAKIGLVRYLGGKFSVWGEEIGLSNLNISSLFIDIEDTLWVATDKGLNHLRKQIVTTYSVKNGLIHNEVYPILQANSGDIYIGTTRGLSVYRDGVFSDVKVLDPNGDRIVTTALYEDQRQRLWIGSLGDLHIYENGKLRQLPGFSQITVWAIKNDREGNIWVATGKGLFEIRDEAIVAKYTTANGLGSDDVKVIHQDRNGAMWFGTYGGLTRIAGGIVKNFTVADGLASDRVRSIYEDASGILWIGTYDGGLSRFSGDGFFNYTIEKGLFNSGVFQILEDESSNFWISCNRGIYRVKRSELEDLAAGKIAKINSVAYGKSDGMLNTEANGGRQPAGIRATDGKFWFPTQDGVSIIDPSNVEVNPNPPQVQIESVLVDRENVDFREAVTLRSDRDNLEIHFTGITFIKPEQVKFRYRMEGLSDKWIELDTRRDVYFPFLPAGDYVFQVIAGNSDGVWNTEGARFKIRVIAPFWRTTWFIVLLAATAVFVIFMIFKLRERDLQRQAALQRDFSRRLIASQEGERKRIAGEMHDSLGQYLLAIKNWAMFGLNSVPEKDASRQYLTEVAETSSLAITEVREIAHNLRPYQLERLGLTNTLRYMMTSVENSSTIKFTTEIGDIDGILSKENEIVLYRIVQECVNNLVKHSGAKNARIIVRLTDQGAEFICVDDGNGFDFEAAKTSAKSGLGLNSIIERVAILEGEMSVESEVTKGTTISVKVRRNL